MAGPVRLALVVLVDGEGRLLLQHRDGGAPVAPWMWTPPGGHVEDGEAPYDAAVRELAEETGLRVGSELVPGGLVPLVEGLVTHGGVGEVEIWAWAASTCAAPDEVRCLEGEAMRFVPPRRLASLPLTRVGAQAIEPLLASATYDALVAQAGAAASRRRTQAHPLDAMVREALLGTFSPADGAWRRVPPWREGVEAVVGFTGHAVLAVGPDVDDAVLGGLAPDGYGGAHHPRVVSALAGPEGWIDSLDVLLAAPGTGACDPLTAPALRDRPDLEGHARATFARSLRDDVRVLGDPPQRVPRGVVTLSRGIGGMREVSVEVPAGARRAGLARSLLRDALGLVPAGEPVVAAVAPGNAASLRAFLGAGFTPIGSVQLYRPRR